MFGANYAPILCQDYHYLQTNWIELPPKPRHLGVPSGVSKTIFEPIWDVWHKPCTYLAPTHTVSPDRPKWDFTWLTSPRSFIGCLKNDFWAYETFSADHAPISLQDYHYLQMDWTELPLEPRHLGLPSGVSKMIFETMTCLAQTVDLSCTNTNTVSKWTKMRFYLTHIR
jgi:hypothetical protein